MKRPGCHRRTAVRGMTLIELMTAMMVSVLLIGTAFTTFWTATQAWEKSKRRTEMRRMLEGSADVITRHLRAIQPPFFEANSVFLALNDSDEYGHYDSVCFLSSANARFPRVLAMSDLCEIEFYIENGDRGVFDEEETATDPTQGGLWMRIDPTPDDMVESGGYLVGLGEQITSLDLRYFDGYEWLEEWYYDTEVPEAVEFSITVSDPMELENPMTLTRLLTLPTASMVNNQTYDTESSWEETGSSTEPGTPEAMPESGGEGETER